MVDKTKDTDNVILTRSRKRKLNDVFTDKVRPSSEPPKKKIKEEPPVSDLKPIESGDDDSDYSSDIGDSDFIVSSTPSTEENYDEPVLEKSEKPEKTTDEVADMVSQMLGDQLKGFFSGVDSTKAAELHYITVLKLLKLPAEEFAKFSEEIKEIVKMISHREPEFMRVLRMNMPIDIKAEIIKRIEQLGEKADDSNSKKMETWVDDILKVPFGKYKDFPVSMQKNTRDEIAAYLKNFYNTLDNAVYGHQNVKEALLEIITRRIVNPSNKGQCIAIVGPPGCGKTSIFRDGFAKALNTPFVSLSMAGVSDEAHLTGFSYTYEGSKYGRICQALINSKCMNPVFFMDELDKVDTQVKGMSVINKLIELTDFSQNHDFEDNYFSGIRMDLSKCLFVFSLNDLSKVDPILRDRLEIIHVNGFNEKEKITISNKYLIPREMKSNNMHNVKMTTDVLRYIIRRYSDKEKGVRKLQRCFQSIFRKINTLSLMDSSILSYKTILEYDANGKIDITPKMIDKFLKDTKQDSLPMSIRMMYM